MLTSGLTNTPLTKLLLIYTIASSVALSILDSKHLVSIHVAPHLWQYGQFWRCLVWQVAGFANSTEALFAAMLVYHSRVVERAWGTRKMATFLVTTLPYTTLLPPLLLVLLLRPLSFHYLNYLPSGTTATIFALLAQYHVSIPSTFRYRISSSTSTTSDADANANANADNSQNTNTTTTTNTGTDASAPSTSTSNAASSKNTPTPTPTLTVLLSDKSTTYLIAAQLALSQFPNMLLPAITGWAVGVAWRNEILPVVPGTSWRVPAWVVGEKEREGGRGRGRGAGSGRGRRGDGGADAEAEAERFEGLRRRLLSEREAVVAASASARGSEGSGSGSGRQRVGGEE